MAGPSEDDSLRKPSFATPVGITPPDYSYLGTGRFPSKPNNLPGGNWAASSQTLADEKGGQSHAELADNIVQWFSTGRSETRAVPHHSEASTEQAESDYSSDGGGLRRRDSLYSVASFDWEDSEMGRNESKGADESEDLEKDTLRNMDYKQRRKHIQRIRIQFNVSSEIYSN